MAADHETDLTPYVPRLLLQWEERYGSARHMAIEGTLVFADVSGFTKLSEALARKGGKAGAEEMADIINYLFGELLMLAAVRGGEMLKYGGDAMLLFFSGEGHAVRGAAACTDMQRRLREIGRVDTGTGVVRLRMSVGAHSGSFDFFVGGRLHRELLVAGPDTTITVAMEAAADATEVLVSPEMATLLPERHIGREKDGGYLLRGSPKAPLVETVPVSRELDAASCLAAPLVTHLSSLGAEPEHRLATVAFLQFLELDRLLDAGRAEDAAQRVDDVLTLVQEALLEFDVSFLATDLAADGGKVMATAGAPVAHGDDEERMLRASRRILDSAPALPVRIGLHRGHVFAGDVGPPFRRTYTTIGDVTNTAARVMGKAMGGQLLALAPVVAAAISVWETEQLEPFLAKGKSEPLVPFSIGVARGPRHRTGGEVPLVGRERERALIDETIGDRSGAAIVEFVGGAGMGKSALLASAEAKAGTRPVISVECDPYSSDIPYAALRTVLEQVLELPAGTDRGRRGTTLARIVDEHATSLRPWLPLLALPIDAEVDSTREVDELDERFVADRLQQVVAELIVATCGGDTVWLIDAAHAMDGASAAALRTLLSRADLPPWAVFVGRRSETDAAPLSEGATIVGLSGLSRQEALTLADAAAGGRLLPSEVEQAATAAGGNPLFVIELVRAATDTRTGEPPDSLSAAITARIDTLPARQRRLLRIASVLGVRVDVSILARCASEEHNLDEVLDDLSEFVEPAGEGSVRFSQAIYRDVAYASLPYRRRRELHAEVASTIERDLGDSAGSELLSLHTFEARLWSDAWRHSKAAGDRARERFATREAVTYYDRAVAAARRLPAVPPELSDVLWRLGMVTFYAGMYPEAEKAWGNGRLLLRGFPEGQARFLYSEADVARRRGLLPLALRRFQRCLKTLHGVESDEAGEWRARALNGLAEVRRLQGKLDESLALASASAEEAHRVDDRRAVALAHASLFATHTAAGRPDEAARYQHVPLEVFEAEGALWHLASFLSSIGIRELENGDWNAALSWYERAREMSERSGDWHQRSIAQNNIGEVLSDQGHASRAEACFRDALRFWVPAGFKLGVGVARSNLARCLARAGRYDEADAEFEEAEQSLGEARAGVYLQYCSGWRAERALLEGDHERARTAASDLAEGKLPPTLAPLVLRILAATTVSQKPADLDEAFERAVAAARAAGSIYDLSVTVAWWRARSNIGPPDEVVEEAQAIRSRLGLVGAPSLAGA